MKPKFRKEAELDLRGAIQGAIWSQFNRTDIYPFQSCINCIHFKENETCGITNNIRPPAKIIVFGCDRYCDIQDIPF